MRKRTAVIALCAAGIAVSALTLGPGALRTTVAGVTDFMDLYAGGKLAFSHDLYSPAAVLRTEAASEGWFSPTRLFMRLPAFAVLFWPISHLPYPVAATLWEALCIAAALAFVAVWPGQDRRTTALACCWSLPLFMATAEGQDIGLLLIWIGLALSLLEKQRPAAAGVVFSLCAAKFHLFLLLPVWIAARRAGRFAAGLGAGGAALIAISFLANGADWPRRYWSLLANPANNPYASVMPNIHGLFEGRPHQGLLDATGIILAGIAVWFAARRGDERTGLAAVLAGGILTAPHAYMADCALLIPAALSVLADRTNVALRSAALFLLTPVPHLFLMALSALPVQVALAAFLCAAALQVPGLENCRFERGLRTGRALP